MRAVGPFIHVTSIVAMIHGLVEAAWYGYVFLLIYGGGFLILAALIRRERQRSERLFQEALAQRDGPEGVRDSPQQTSNE